LASFLFSAIYGHVRYMVNVNYARLRAISGLTKALYKLIGLHAMTKNNLTFITQILVMIALAILIVLTPSIRFIPYIEWHDCQRIFQIALLGLVLLDSISLGLKNDTHLQLNPLIRLGFYILLVLGILSTLRSINPRFATIEFTVFAALCYLSLMTARLFSSYKESGIKYLVYALWGSITLYMTSFYTGYLTATIAGKAISWPEPFYGFSNIRLFQQYQLWGLGLICFPLLALNLKQNTRRWLYVALGLWWVLLFYAASRGVVLGWLVAMVTTAIIYNKHAWSFLRLQTTSAISGLMGYFFLFKGIPSLITTLASSSAASPDSPVITTSTIFRATTYDRLDLWKVAYVMIENFPLLGVGPMHFYNYTPFGSHPHNSILQIASEWGLPATMIILCIIGYSMACWYKRFNFSSLHNESKLNKNLAVILFFTIIANGSYSLVEGVIVMPISQVLMFIVIGLMIGQYTNGSEHKNTTKSRRKIHFRPVLAVITLVLLTLSVMPELKRGLASTERYLKPGERAFSMRPETINPRIWMQQRRVEKEQP